MKWMIGTRSQISQLIGGRALTLFTFHFPWTSRRAPVTSRQFTYQRDETHKAEQPPRRDWSVTKVMFDELWIYSDKGEEMVSINIVFFY